MILTVDTRHIGLVGVKVSIARWSVTDGVTVFLNILRHSSEWTVRRLE